MSAALRRTAEAAQRYADELEDEIGAPVDWDDIANAYLVAVDAWLEAGEPEEAAHQLLRAAEYRRWARADRDDRVVGGIARSAIDMETGIIDRHYEWQWRYHTVLSIQEAAEIARLAGWLEPHPSYDRQFPARNLRYLGQLAPLEEVDANGRPNASRLRWLFLLTDTSTELATGRERFREILASRLRALRTSDRDRPRSRRR